MSVSGIIFSNLHEKNIPELTRLRTMASVPFGCRYRLIDFALSNMVNAGITDIRVITQYNYRSLMDHLGSGKDWDLARHSGGLKMLPPYISAHDKGEIQNQSRLDSLVGVMSSINHIKTDYVVLSDCDVICNLDLNKIIDAHEKSGASLTALVKDKEFEERTLSHVTVIDSDADGNIVDVATNPLNCRGVKSLFMNIMIINTADLKSFISDAIAHGFKSFTNDIIRRNMNKYNFKVYKYDGIYKNIYSLKEYYDCNMQLLSDKAFREELFGNKNRPVITKVRNSAPTKYTATAKVSNSFIADGCLIEGTVENSILFRGVKIGKNTVVKNCILYQDTYTGQNVFLNCVIADKNTLIRDGRMLSGHESLPFFIEKGKMI